MIRITSGGRSARNEALTGARDPDLSGNAVTTAATVASTYTPLKFIWLNAPLVTGM
jgi:hypothetical protein